ncbi:MAG: hypothetical protein HY754_13030 [Nitrospirae bacterium]|nr:hypothetical protein [Nitrospirota bacterium]
MIKRYLFFIPIILLSLLSACASTNGVKTSSIQQGEPTTAQPAIHDESRQDDSEKKLHEQVQELAYPEFKKERKPKPLPPREPIDPKRVVRMEMPVLINAEAMPLSDFIIYALGDILKVTFFIDEPVKNMKNPVTLRMTQEMPPDKVLEIVIGFLEKYDLIVEEKAGALYITKTRPPAQKLDIRIGKDVPDSPAEIVQIVPIKHVRADEVANIIREIYRPNVNIRPYYIKENVLFLSGPASSVKEVVDLIDMFDVPYMKSRRLFMIRLTYWQTDEFIKQLSAILDGLGFVIAGRPKDPGIFFIPIKVLNSVLVLAPEDDSMEYILEWQKRLDTPESAGSEEKSFIYTPKYSKASDLVDALKNLYTVVQPPAAPAASQPKQVLPAQSVLSIAGLKMAADDKRNIILISASPAQYKAILGYLESLDVPPRQVLIEVTIAELTLTDDLKYGLEWYIKNSITGSSFTMQTLDSLGLSTGTGLAFQFVSNNQKFEAAINAFAQENRINILSNPRLLVIDNQEAVIQIGTDVPIISGETRSTSAEQQTTVTTQSVQYKSTGLIVKVKPNINTEGMLNLDISLESSEAAQNTLSDVSSPIILTRRLTTNVVATTEQTILLGGLMSESLNDTETKVPLVGDIPILGNLFKTTAKSKTKTELIIMIKPIIITSTEKAVKLTNDLKERLEWLK